MNAQCDRLETKLCVLEETFFQELTHTTDAERAGRLDEGIQLIDAALDIIARGTADAALSVLQAMPLLWIIQNRKEPS